MTTISLNLEQAEKRFELLDRFLDETTKLANEMLIAGAAQELLEEISEVYNNFLIHLMLADTDKTTVRNLLEGKDSDD